MHAGAEILMDTPMIERGRLMLDAMAAAAPAGSEMTKAYAGRHQVLIVYGVGLPQRLAAVQRHRACEGLVVMWDLGYWDRAESMRLAIDTPHPTVPQLAASALPAGRRDFALRADADPAGPVLIVGLGDKSAAMYGLQPMQWERRALQAARARHPGRAIAFRPKGKREQHLAGAELRHGMPIEQALRGCSLVVCRHSNVAVDACIAGVPVECEDGAARALYAAGSAPAPAERAAFLARLSWWNWRPAEAGQAWDWIRKVTSCG